MLSKNELAQQGIKVAAELNEVQSRYHEKSDSNDILHYEALTLRAKSRDLLEDCGVNEDLVYSTLLSTWGAKLAATLPDVVTRVRKFHADYEAHRRK